MTRTELLANRRGRRAGGRIAACIALVCGAARADPETSTGGVEVVVEETRAPAAARDDTAASSVVSGEALEAPGSSSAEVLARVPGVEISRTGSTSDLATAAIRGATSAQTPIYLAGVRLNDDVTGVADLSTIPLFMIDRVEVYRGNAPAFADRLGIGGAVFFEPRFAGASEVGAGASAGSFGEGGLWASGAVTGERASEIVAVRHEWAENDYPYAGDDGATRLRHNADFEATDAWSIARYDAGDGARVTALLHAYAREQGTPGLAIVENDRARTETQRFLGAVSARVPCGHASDGTEDCFMELTTSGLFGNAVLDDPQSLLETAPVVVTTGERLEETARATVKVGERVSLGASVSESLDRIEVAPSDQAPVNAERFTTRPAANATLHAGESTDLAALFDVECDHTRGAAQLTSGVCTPEPGGRIGARQRLTSALEIRGNVGRYVRTPTLGELYGVSANVRGNETLAPETGQTADLGARVVTSSRALRVEADAYGFVRSADDLVSYRQNVLGVIVPYNVGRARVLGAEIAADLAAFGAISNTLAVTLLDPRDTTPGRALANDLLPFRSRLVVSDYTEVHSKNGASFLAVDRAAIGVRVVHRASRYADPAGLIVLPAQTTFDLEASASFFRRSLTVRFALSNVFDAREVDTVGLPLPGRSLHAALEAYFR